MYFLNGNLHFNATHVIVAVCILAALDCVLSYLGVVNATGLKEMNPVMRWAMNTCAKVLGQSAGVIVALLLVHYVPIGLAYYFALHGHANGWGYLIDGIFIFGAVDIWDAYQLHKVGKL
jgi:hypothetical protein